MAKAVAKGVEAAGAEVKLFQVAETLPAEVLTKVRTITDTATHATHLRCCPRLLCARLHCALSHHIVASYVGSYVRVCACLKMYAPAKDASIPVISDPAELEGFDGFIFGSGTRFGMIASQLKAFLDSTGGLWAKGALVGKTAGFFYSTGTQGGGQETTALTFITQLTHHGIIYIPIGYSDPSLMNMDEVHGGSPYGAGTLAGPTGARQPSALELGVAEHQGKHIATITGALKRGRALPAQ